MKPATARRRCTCSPTWRCCRCAPGRCCRCRRSVRRENIVLWLVAAVILHDLVLLPAYSLLDRLAARPLGGAINYVRVPAGLSLLLLLVFCRTIAGKRRAAFHHASGLTYDGYLGRWLLVTGGLFALSGALYLLRVEDLTAAVPIDRHGVRVDRDVERRADARERAPRDGARAGGVFEQPVGRRERDPQRPARGVERDRVRGVVQRHAADQLEPGPQMEDEHGSPDRVGDVERFAPSAASRAGPMPAATLRHAAAASSRRRSRASARARTGRRPRGRDRRAPAPPARGPLRPTGRPRAAAGSRGDRARTGRRSRPVSPGPHARPAARSVRAIPGARRRAAARRHNPRGPAARRR